MCFTSGICWEDDTAGTFFPEFFFFFLKIRLIQETYRNLLKELGTCLERWDPEVHSSSPGTEVHLTFQPSSPQSC